MLCKLWLANLMLGLREQTVYLCLKSTHFICVAPIYKPHIVCSDGDGMHGSISPDAINFTIKYMMGGGVSGLMQSLWPSGRGILVCCIMSWYFVVLGFNKRALF